MYEQIERLVNDDIEKLSGQELRELIANLMSQLGLYASKVTYRDGRTYIDVRDKDADNDY